MASRVYRHFVIIMNEYYIVILAVSLYGAVQWAWRGGMQHKASVRRLGLELRLVSGHNPNT